MRTLNSAIFLKREKLQEVHRRRKEEWKGKKMPEWVFCSEDRNFVNEYNFRTRKFYPLFKKKEGDNKGTQLRQIRVHDLRHTYASLMLQQGESVTYVKEQWGIIRFRLLWIFTAILSPAQIVPPLTRSKHTYCRLFNLRRLHTTNALRGD
jgi:site-specific recombinase XerD